MSVDIEKVSKLVGLVDKLIQIKGIENSLDESAVMNLIRSGLDFSGASYSDEEIEAVKRDITWKYQIFTMPG